MPQLTVALKPSYLGLAPGFVIPGTRFSFSTAPQFAAGSLEDWGFILSRLEIQQMQVFTTWLRLELDENFDQSATISELTYASIALQILGPVGEKGISLIGVIEDGSFRPSAASRRFDMHGTAWSLACSYQLNNLMNFAAIVQRLRLNVEDKVFPPIKNSALLFVQGLRTTQDNSRIRTLLWVMGLDALLMASNSTCFQTRLNNLLGSNSSVFEPRQDGMRPKYKVGEVASDLYTLRSEIAHGGRETKYFSEVIGFGAENGTVINDSFTRAQVLEECSLFLLQRALMIALSTELVKTVENASTWRKYLGGKHQQ